MKAVVASAPGKLFVTGEYAVLDRAPALLTAVNVRAVCRLRPASGEVSRLVTPPLSMTPAVFRIADDMPQWEDEPVPLLDAAWRALTEARRRKLAESAWHISLDTSAFFLKDRKLGLGSSAAALAALTGALWAATGDLPAEADAFDALRSAHTAWQGGGSGADLAVTLAGGNILYRRDPRIAAPVALPGGLEVLPVWSGRPASTGEFLRKLAEFQENAPERFRERFAVLEQEAEEAAVAASAGDADAFLEAFEDQGAALRALGEAAELPIWSEDHERIGEIARANGVRYKPSGAGGGDIGLALIRAGDEEGAERLKSGLSSAGYSILPLGFGARGLHIEVVND